MADQGFKKGPSSNIKWGSFTNSTLFGGPGSALKSPEQSGVVPKIELKRMRSMGSSDEDENHYAKRTKRESPPKALTKLSSAANSFRRGGSVKSLVWYFRPLHSNCSFFPSRFIATFILKNPLAIARSPRCNRRQALRTGGRHSPVPHPLAFLLIWKMLNYRLLCRKRLPDLEG
jgi:hypothetical protein